MANKPQGKNWNEIQMAITAIAITATLGFWNLFATPEKAQAAAQVIDTATPPPPPVEAAPEATQEPSATTIALRPVKIIFGVNAPQLNVVQVSAAPVVSSAPVVVVNVPAVKKKGGGGGGGSGGVTTPKPPPSTGSSKP